MNSYNPIIHHRRSIRLKGYDYSQAGFYFITLCVQDRKHLFGEISNGKMKLNLFGKIANEEWLRTKEIRKNCTLEEFIIMPNHFHAIISIDYKIENNNQIGKFRSPSQTIGAIIRGFKGATTKRIKEYWINKNLRTGESQCTGESQFAPTEILEFLENKISHKKSIWQRDYWEHIIRDENEHSRISHYIINNPIKWGKDKFSSNSSDKVKEESFDYNHETWMV